MSVPAHLPCNSRCNLSPCLSPYFWRKKKTWRKGWLGWVWEWSCCCYQVVLTDLKIFLYFRKSNDIIAKESGALISLPCAHKMASLMSEGVWEHVFDRRTDQCFPKSRLCREHRQNAWEAGACAHPLAQRVFPQLTDCSVDDSNTVRGSHVSTRVSR